MRGPIWGIRDPQRFFQPALRPLKISVPASPSSLVHVLAVPLRLSSRFLAVSAPVSRSTRSSVPRSRAPLTPFSELHGQAYGPRAFVFECIVAPGCSVSRQYCLCDVGQFVVKPLSNGGVCHRLAWRPGLRRGAPCIVPHSPRMLGAMLVCLR